MTGRIFYIADVFAEEKYAGNQLAVICNADSLSTEAMQAIAREMHFSETTFILSETPHDGGYDVRIFTPSHELPFAGHPTLGTAFIIQQKMIGRPVETVNLNLKVGRIPVSFNYREGRPDIIWMKQIAPVFDEVFTPAELSPVLGLAVDDFDARFPIQSVSTGVPFVMTPLKTREAIKRARVNLDACRAFVKPNSADAFLLFCPEPYDPANSLNARVFAEMHGVTEDPATGSANGCLAGYLAKYRYFGSATVDARVEQGYEIERPSLLYLRAAPDGSSFEVRVGGKVVLVAEGKLV